VNLFIVGWNLPEELCSRALAELQGMTDIYPRLDPRTVWHYSSRNGSVFAASMHTDNEAASPRRYVTKGENQVVFYSGLPINSNGGFAAHNSEALSSNWEQLTESLEGMFCIVRAQDNPSQLEIITDIVGMEQAFCFRKNGLWLMSNSVQLIERVAGNQALDPVGVSLYVGMDWVGGDHTLKSDIKVIPGGQLWSWREGDNEPRKISYYSPSKLACLPKRKLKPSFYKQVSDDIFQTLSVLSRNFENINCALTGGRDSRLAAVFFIYGGLPVQYYTFGETSGTDAKIAQQISEAFNLNYKLISVTSSDVLKNWDEICRQIVLQGDGMASIDLAASILACLNMNKDHLYIDVGGTGGELAKGFYSRPNLDLFMNRFDIGKMKNYMANIIARDYGGIIRREAVEITRNHVNSFVEQYTDLGIAPIDIPDVFFLYSRLRRRRGSNKRVYMQYQDFFTPYITRSFIEAVFSMPATQRYTQPLHYNIIRLLSPELHSLPFDSGHWKSQKSAMHLIKFYRNMISGKARRKISSMTGTHSQPKKLSPKMHTATDMFDNVVWFKEKREQLRELCLDQNNSLIWDFVNRSLFDKITSPNADPEDFSQYGTYITLCYRIATLFNYERSLN